MSTPPSSPPAEKQTPANLHRNTVQLLRVRPRRARRLPGPRGGTSPDLKVRLPINIGRLDVRHPPSLRGCEHNHVRRDFLAVDNLKDPGTKLVYGEGWGVGQGERGMVGEGVGWGGGGERRRDRGHCVRGGEGMRRWGR